MLWRIVILILLPFTLSAQSFRVADISIKGNKKTKEFVIHREMTFEVGDILPAGELNNILDRNRQLILNTHLFTGVEVKLSHLDPEKMEIFIEISVRESWYLYPVPRFDLADRNFNTWWNTHNRSLDRVNFGGSFFHMNFTGRNDQLKMTAQYGYTQKYEVDYKVPYLGNSKDLGLQVKAFMSRNREVTYDIENNRERFYQDEDNFIFQRFEASAALNYRHGLFNYFGLTLRYQNQFVGDQLADSLNRDFFLYGRESQQFFSLELSFTRDRRDIRAFPINGHHFQAMVRKEGMGVYNDHNVLLANISYARFLPLNQRFSYAFRGKGQANLLRQKIPFYNYKGLGYGENYVRGYEYYVINGSSYVLFRNSLRFEFLNKTFDISRWMPLDNYGSMPVKMYLSLNADTGYVRDPWYRETNHLTNQWLWGGGPGLSILFFHDKLFRMEYSFNHLGENGLFLSFNYSMQ